MHFIFCNNKYQPQQQPPPPPSSQEQQQQQVQQLQWRIEHQQQQQQQQQHDDNDCKGVVVAVVAEQRMAPGPIISTTTTTCRIRWWKKTNNRLKNNRRWGLLFVMGRLLFVVVVVHVVIVLLTITITTIISIQPTYAFQTNPIIYPASYVVSSSSSSFRRPYNKNDHHNQPNEPYYSRSFFYPFQLVQRTTTTITSHSLSLSSSSNDDTNKNNTTIIVSSTDEVTVTETTSRQEPNQLEVDNKNKNNNNTTTTTKTTTKITVPLPSLWKQKIGQYKNCILHNVLRTRPNSDSTITTTTSSSSSSSSIITNNNETKKYDNNNRNIDNDDNDNDDSIDALCDPKNTNYYKVRPRHRKRKLILAFIVRYLVPIQQRLQSILKTLSATFLGQFSIMIVLYWFHLIILTQHQLVFPFQLLPFVTTTTTTTTTNFNIGCSIGYDSIAGIIVTAWYYLYNYYKYKQQQQQQHEQEKYKNRTEEEIKLDLQQYFDNLRKNITSIAIDNTNNKNRIERTTPPPWNLPISAVVVPQPDHQVLLSSSSSSSGAVPATTLLIPVSTKINDSMPIDSTEQQPVATSTTTTIATTGPASTSIVAAVNTSTNNSSIPVDSTGTVTTAPSTTDIIPQWENQVRIAIRSIQRLIKEFIPSYKLFQGTFITTTVLLVIAYYNTGRYTLIWEDFIYTLSAKGFPITIPLQRSLLVLLGHLSWVGSGSLLLQLIPSPRFFSPNVFYQSSDKELNVNEEASPVVNNSRNATSSMESEVNVKLSTNVKVATETGTTKAISTTIKEQIFYKWFTVQVVRPSKPWIWWTIGGYYVSSWLFNIADCVNHWVLPAPVIFNQLEVESVVTQLVNPEYNDFIASLVGYIAPCLSAPIWEELLYRGYLLSGLTAFFKLVAASSSSSSTATSASEHTNNKPSPHRNYSFGPSYHWACVVQAIIFSAHHMSITAAIPLAVLGYIWAVLYTRSQNLLTVILIHSMWNSRVFLGSWLGL